MGVADIVEGSDIVAASEEVEATVSLIFFRRRRPLRRKRRDVGADCAHPKAERVAASAASKAATTSQRPAIRAAWTATHRAATAAVAAESSTGWAPGLHLFVPSLVTRSAWVVGEQRSGGHRRSVAMALRKGGESKEILGVLAQICLEPKWLRTPLFR